MNAYEILGVDAHASDVDIRKAFKRLAAKYHPDVPGTGDVARFREITDAYRLIGTEARRKVVRPDGFKDLEELMDEFLSDDFLHDALYELGAGLAQKLARRIKR